MGDSFLDINQILAEYTKDINKTVDDVMGTVAKDAAQKLRTNSPKQTGDYAKNWAVKKQNAKRVVYNKAPTYRLTHLLENGHDVVVNGKKVGHVNPKPHIKPVEEWVQEEVPALLEERLQNVD